MGAIIYKLGALAILLLSGRTILKSSSDDNDGHTDNGKNDQGGDVDLTVIEGIEQFREHLGGRLCITLPQGIGRRVEVNDMDLALVEDGIAFLKTRVQER